MLENSLFGGMDPFSMLEGMFSDGGMGSQMQAFSFGGGGGGQMMSMSYSSTSQMGPDGRPVVTEVRHSAFADGKGHRQEQYELNDGARHIEQFGLARGIGDRHVAMHKTRHANSGEEQTHTHFEGMDEAELDTFDDQWQRGTHGQEFWTHSQRLLTGHATGRRQHAAPSALAIAPPPRHPSRSSHVAGHVAGHDDRRDPSSTYPDINPYPTGPPQSYLSTPSVAASHRSRYRDTPGGVGDARPYEHSRYVDQDQRRARPY